MLCIPPVRGIWVEPKKSSASRVLMAQNVSKEMRMKVTVAEIAALTAKRLKALSPLADCCRGNGNTVGNWARIEDHLGMIERVPRCGLRPISLAQPPSLWLLQSRPSWHSGFAEMIESGAAGIGRSRLGHHDSHRAPI